MFRRQKIAIFSDFHGVSVSKSQELRRGLKKENAEYKVVKKTLLGRALNMMNIDIKARELKGELSITFGYGDEVAPARIVSKFSKDNETFKILGAVMGVRRLNDKDVLSFAKLPSQEILISQLIGVLQSPLRGSSQRPSGEH